jgi:hypothetical protein
MGYAAKLGPVALHEYARRADTVKECLAAFARFLKSAGRRGACIVASVTSSADPATTTPHRQLQFALKTRPIGADLVARGL